MSGLKLPSVSPKRSAKSPRSQLRSPKSPGPKTKKTAGLAILGDDTPTDNNLLGYDNGSLYADETLDKLPEIEKEIQSIEKRLQAEVAADFKGRRRSSTTFIAETLLSHLRVQRDEAVKARAQAELDAEDLEREKISGVAFETHSQLEHGKVVVKGQVSDTTRAKVTARAQRERRARYTAKYKALRAQEDARMQVLKEKAVAWKKEAIQSENDLVERKWGGVWKDIVKNPVKTIGPVQLPTSLADFEAWRASMPNTPYLGAFGFIVACIIRLHPSYSSKLGLDLLKSTLHEDCLQAKERRPGEAPGFAIRKHSMTAIQFLNIEAISSFVSGASPGNDYRIDPNSVEIDFDFKGSTRACTTEASTYQNELNATYKIFVKTNGAPSSHPQSRQIELKFDGELWKVRAFKKLNFEVIPGTVQARKDREEAEANAIKKRKEEVGDYEIPRSFSKAASGRDIERTKLKALMAKRAKYERLHPEAREARLLHEAQQRAERRKLAKDGTRAEAERLAKLESKKSYAELLAELEEEAAERKY